MSKRRIIRIGQYGSNEGLKQLIQNSSYISQNGADRYCESKEGNLRNSNLSVIKKKDLNNLNRSFIEIQQDNHFYNQPIKTQPNSSINRPYKETVGVRDRQVSFNSQQRSIRSQSTAKKSDAIYENIDNTQSNFIKSQSITPQIQDNNYKRIKLDQQDINYSQIKKQTSPNSHIKQSLLNEQKDLCVNLNNYRHVSNNRVTHEYVTSLRKPDLLYKSNVLTRTITRPYSVEYKYPSNRLVKNNRDFKLHHEKRKRIGGSITNQSQLDFDLHLREYSKDNQFQINQEKRWHSPPSRNLTFKEHQKLNRSFIKLENSQNRSIQKENSLLVSAQNASYLDYPNYDDKILRKDYPLLRELSKDRSYRKQGDLSQSNMLWELSLNSYIKNDSSIIHKSEYY